MIYCYTNVSVGKFRADGLCPKLMSFFFAEIDYSQMIQYKIICLQEKCIIILYYDIFIQNVSHYRNTKLF